MRRSTAPSTALRVAPDAELERAVERAVARAAEHARKGTKGRVHGNNVTVGVSIVDLEGRAVRVARQARVALRHGVGMTAVIPDQTFFAAPFEVGDAVVAAWKRADAKPLIASPHKTEEAYS